VVDRYRPCAAEGSEIINPSSEPLSFHAQGGQRDVRGGFKDGAVASRMSFISGRPYHRGNAGGARHQSQTTIPAKITDGHHATQTPFSSRISIAVLWNCAKILPRPVGSPRHWRLIRPEAARPITRTWPLSVLSHADRPPVKYVVGSQEIVFFSTFHARDQSRPTAILAPTLFRNILGIKVNDVHRYRCLLPAFPSHQCLRRQPGGRLMGAPYRFMNYLGRLSVVSRTGGGGGGFFSKPQPVSRGSVNPIACSAVTESLMRRLGRRLGLDPFEIRTAQYHHPGHGSVHIRRPGTNSTAVARGLPGQAPAEMDYPRCETGRRTRAKGVIAVSDCDVSSRSRIPSGVLMENGCGARISSFSSAGWRQS